MIPDKGHGKIVLHHNEDGSLQLRDNLSMMWCACGGAAVEYYAGELPQYQFKCIKCSYKYREESEVQRLREEIERINIESQGWEDEYTALKRRYEELDRSALETLELLKDASSKLQDALTVISDALTDVMDMLEVSEMERRDMELCPQANMLSLHDELQAAIDRIQEGRQS